MDDQPSIPPSAPRSYRRVGEGVATVTLAELDRMVRRLGTVAELEVDGAVAATSHVHDRLLEGANSSPPDAERRLGHHRSGSAIVTVDTLEGPLPAEVHATTFDLGDGRTAILRVVDGPAADGADEHREQQRRMDSLARFAGGIAHDYNNLLAVVLHHCEQAQRRPDLDVDLRHSLRQIHGASSRAADLARHLLVLSQREVSERELIDVDERLEELAPLLRTTLGEGVELSLRSGPGDKLVRLGPSHLQQILVGFALNSRDAMGQVGEFEVATSHLTLPSSELPAPGLSPGEYICIEVSDSGPGIPEHVAAHVFEPFYTTKRSGAGGGLGLALTYGIVAQAGGRVVLRRDQNVGAAFICLLPVAHHAASVVEPMALRNSAPPSARLTVLVVDDEAPLRRAVARTLRESGFLVEQATDAEHAFELMKGQHVDLVLTDVVMPGASGVELADAIHAATPDLPVVFMSGYPQDAIQRRGLDPASMHYLQKPFTRRELLELMSRAIGAGRLEELG